jgi:hypothetical protein
VTRYELETLARAMNWPPVRLGDIVVEGEAAWRTKVFSRALAASQLRVVEDALTGTLDAALRALDVQADLQHVRCPRCELAFRPTLGRPR